MKYKLIASDFDGTIYDGEHVPPRVVDAIAAYRRAGGKFVVATGRIFESIRKKVPTLGADDELIACQGAALYSTATGKVLKRFPLPYALAKKAVDFYEANGDVCHAYADHEFYVAAPNDYSATYAAYCEVTPTYLGCPLSGFLPKMEAINKIIAIIDADKIDDRIKELSDLLGEEAEVTKSAPMFLEVTSAKAGKGNCLVALAEMLGIPLDEVVAVGDQLNDLSMIKAAGLGVTVENGIDVIKQNADLVLPSVKDGGVADLIEKILRDEL